MEKQDIKQKIKDIYQEKGEFAFNEIADLLVELGVVDTPTVHHFEDTLTVKGDFYSFETTSKPELFYLNGSTGKDSVHDPLTVRKNLILFKQERLNGLINSKAYVEFMIENNFEHLSPPNIMAITTNPEDFNACLNSKEVDFNELSYNNTESFLNNRDIYREIDKSFNSPNEHLEFFENQVLLKEEYENAIKNNITFDIPSPKINKKEESNTILSFLKDKVSKKVNTFKNK